MTLLDNAQLFAYIGGGMAGFATFAAVGLPIIGKYPGRLRHSLNDLFTGDLQAKMDDQTNELRNEIAHSSEVSTRAVHDQTVVISSNHEEAMQRVNTLDQRLHAHESNLALHRQETEE